MTMTHITTDAQYMSNHRPEIWAGLECTINRVKDDYKDQLNYSGHYSRPDDIDEFIQIGIKAIRYPVLWEHHQQNSQEQIQWSWTDRQLRKIRNNEIKIIAGLLHHGSGPFFTNLYDKSFPGEFACYASKVA